MSCLKLMSETTEGSLSTKETFAILISSTRYFVQFPAIEQNVCFILQPELLPPAGCY